MKIHDEASARKALSDAKIAIVFIGTVAFATFGIFLIAPSFAPACLLLYALLLYGSAETCWEIVRARKVLAKLAKERAQ